MAESFEQQMARWAEQWAEGLRVAFEELGGRISASMNTNENGAKPEPADDVHVFKQAMPGGSVCAVCGEQWGSAAHPMGEPGEEPVTVDGLNAEIRQLRTELEAAKVDRPWWHQLRDQFIAQAERLAGKPVTPGIAPQGVLRVLEQIEGAEQLRGQIRGYRHSLQDRDARIAQMRSNLQARDAKVTALEMDLRRKDEENAEQRQHIEQLLTAANTSDDTIVRLGEDNLLLAQKLAASEEGGARRSAADARRMGELAEDLAKANQAVSTRNARIADLFREVQELRQHTAPSLSDTMLKLQEVITRQVEVFGSRNGMTRAVDLYRRIRGQYTVEHDAEHGINTFDSAVEALSTGFALKWPWDRASFDRIVKGGDRYVHAAALAMCAEDVRQFVNKRIGGTE